MHNTTTLKINYSRIDCLLAAFQSSHDTFVFRYNWFPEPLIAGEDQGPIQWTPSACKMLFLRSSYKVTFVIFRSRTANRCLHFQSTAVLWQHVLFGCTVWIRFVNSALGSKHWKAWTDIRRKKGEQKSEQEKEELWQEVSPAGWPDEFVTKSPKM
jgi:hypothetical protein